MVRASAGWGVERYGEMVRCAGGIVRTIVLYRGVVYRFGKWDSYGILIYRGKKLVWKGRRGYDWGRRLTTDSGNGLSGLRCKDQKHGAGEAEEFIGLSS